MRKEVKLNGLVLVMTGKIAPIEPFFGIFILFLNNTCGWRSENFTQIYSIVRFELIPKKINAQHFQWFVQYDVN